MIYVSQGHERGIGLEVFLKSFMLLTHGQQAFFQLITYKKTLEDQLALLNIPYEMNQSSLIIAGYRLQLVLLPPITKKDETQTSQSLLYCLEKMTTKDKLFTLPSSKDQFIYQEQRFSGHTELLRNYYKNNQLTMVFQYKATSLMLITDHLPLEKVPTMINSNIIKSKTKTCLDHLTQIKKVIFSGLNPHDGENGLLGKEEIKITQAMEGLKGNYPNIAFKGPISGDTFFMNPEQECLYVSMFHDQGLTAFKTKYQFYGSHLTLGLPFKRYSVDHGTAFDLYGKNVADYMGCHFVLKQLLQKS